MSTHSPTGSGSGAVDEDRWVRLSSPRVSSVDVPSGKTSHSFADRVATGSLDRSRTRSLGCPSSDISSAGHSQVSEAASSYRWSVGWPHGSDPAQLFQAAVPTSGSTSYVTS